jgi:branched-chain amino acid aminotransferase
VSENERLIWRDGELIPFAEATVHVLSHAANRGSEVFDVLRVVETAGGPAVVGLRPHVARFDQSMELMAMDHSFSVGELERAVAETVLANPGTAVVKLIAAWADVSHGVTPATRRPSVLVAALPPSEEIGIVDSPVTVQTATMPKIPAGILPPSLKVAAAYTPGLRYHLAATEAGFDDVVFRNLDGSLAESTSLSLLVVNGGRILVPPLDVVLDGITRRLLLDVAQHDGIGVDVRPVDWDEVTSAGELILTSTNHFVRPVGRLDDQTLDAPGPVSSRLGELLGDLVEERHPLAGRWLTSLRGLVEGSGGGQRLQVGGS